MIILLLGREDSKKCWDIKKTQVYKTASHEVLIEAI